jgi:hypothetical protein
MTQKKNEDPLTLAGKNVLARPDYSPFIVTALRALANGTANAHQQKEALDYIIYQVCGTYDLAYRRNERDTNVALGKQFAGQTLVFLLNEAVVSKESLDKQSARQAGEQPNVD